MRFLRKNTAVLVTVGPFYDKTDGVTIKTALTISNERITLTADTDDGSAPTNILDNVTGATSGTANDLNYITGNDAGMMQLEFSAADTNRLGRMFLSITDAANHVPVFHEFMVVNAALYDAFFATSGGAIPNVAAGASTGLPLAVDASGRVDVLKINGTSQTARDLGASVLLSSGTGTGQLDFTSGVVKANAVQLLGTAWLTPGTAGTPDVNAKFHGGTSQTGRDIGASVLLSAGTGTGQLDFTSGVVKANATKFGGADVTATTSVTFPSTCTVATTTGAVGSVTGNVGGNLIGSVGSIGAGAIASTSFAAGAINGAAIADNAISDGKVASDVTIASVTGSVGSVTGDIGGNVFGSIYGVAADAITSASFATGAITAASIAADAITDAKVASDVTIASVTGSVGSVTGLTVATIADGVWNEAQADHVFAGSVGESLSKIDDVLTDTAEIGPAGSGLSSLPWNSGWDAEIQSECEDALAAYDPPTNAEMEARTLLAADYFDPATDTVANVTTVGSVDDVTSIVDGVLAGTGDTGVSIAKAIEMLAALAAGKVSASSAAGVTTLTYKKRDGSTTSFTVVVTESDKTRATTGALS